MDLHEFCISAKGKGSNGNTGYSSSIYTKDDAMSNFTILIDVKLLYFEKIAGDYNSFLEFIKGLPAQPQPEVYGFHSNADISKENTEVNRLIASLLLAVPIEDAKQDEDEGGEHVEEEKDEKPTVEHEGEEAQEAEGGGAEGEVQVEVKKPAGPMTTEEVMQNLSVDILHKLPANFDVEQAQMKYPVTYFQSMNTVLCQVNFVVNFLSYFSNKLLEDKVT